jgi:hypothetical protein
MLFELLLAATILWSTNAFSFHTVSIGLPVVAVLLGITKPALAFSGFSSSTWFLVLAVELFWTGLCGGIFRPALNTDHPFSQWQVSACQPAHIDAR